MSDYRFRYIPVVLHSTGYNPGLLTEFDNKKGWLVYTKNRMFYPPLGQVKLFDPTPSFGMYCRACTLIQLNVGREPSNRNDVLVYFPEGHNQYVSNLARLADRIDLWFNDDYRNMYAVNQLERERYEHSKWYMPADKRERIHDDYAQRINALAHPALFRGNNPISEFDVNLAPSHLAAVYDKLMERYYS